MSEDIAITVKSVSKDFKLPHQSKESIKSFFTNMFSLGSNSYETQHALKDITFDIKKGEFFGIVGRNGSGKRWKQIASVASRESGRMDSHGGTESSKD